VSEWTHAICPQCWDKWFGDRAPVALAEAVREWELCCFCADGTNAGLYVRYNPALLLCEGIHEETSANPGPAAKAGRRAAAPRGRR